MKVVLDTNILVSATINPHEDPAKVLDAWHENRYDLLLSPLILEEIADVIKRPHIRTHLLNLKEYRTIRIVSAADFLKTVESEENRRGLQKAA